MYYLYVYIPKKAMEPTRKHRSLIGFHQNIDTIPQRAATAIVNQPVILVRILSICSGVLLPAVPSIYM